MIAVLKPKSHFLTGSCILIEHRCPPMQERADVTPFPIPVTIFITPAIFLTIPVVHQSHICFITAIVVVQIAVLFFPVIYFTD